MKKCFFLFALIPAITIAQYSGIVFYNGTLADATSEAKKDNKMIFVDCYAEWCYPCKWMADNVFTDTVVASFYNKNFVSIKLDGEKGEGIDFAKKNKLKTGDVLEVKEK